MLSPPRLHASWGDFNVIAWIHQSRARAGTAGYKNYVITQAKPCTVMQGLITPFIADLWPVFRVRVPLFCWRRYGIAPGYKTAGYRSSRWCEDTAQRR